jgi:glycosyltransferase involved in cell wall biosynthesis
VRVALVNNFFPPRASGSAHLTEGIARRLAERGVEVLVLTASHADAPREETRDGYRIVRIPSRTLPKSKLTMRFDVNFTLTPRNVRRVFRTLDEFQPDLIHQHGQFFDLTFISAAYARRRSIPTVLSVHTRLEHTTRVHNAILALADVTLVRATIALSRPHVVVMDRHMYRYVTRRYGIPEWRLAPIPVGVDPARRGTGGAAVRRSLGLGDRPIVLSLGHVIPVRDRLALIEAMPALVERQPDVAVVVVGIVYDDRFIRRAEQLGVVDHLVVTGGITKDEVPDYLDAANVETHDLQGFGLGTASLETMAAGVPVVASVPEDNFLGFRLQSGRDLVLVPRDDPIALAESISNLLDDPELALRVANGQRDLIEARFTLDAVTDRHVELYEEMLAARGKAAGPRRVS